MAVASTARRARSRLIVVNPRRTRPSQRSGTISQAVLTTFGRGFHGDEIRGVISHVREHVNSRAPTGRRASYRAAVSGMIHSLDPNRGHYDYGGVVRKWEEPRANGLSAAEESWRKAVARNRGVDPMSGENSRYVRRARSNAVLHGWELKEMLKDPRVQRILKAIAWTQPNKEKAYRQSSEVFQRLKWDSYVPEGSRGGATYLHQEKSRTHDLLDIYEQCIGKDGLFRPEPAEITAHLIGEARTVSPLTLFRSIAQPVFNYRPGLSKARRIALAKEIINSGEVMERLRRYDPVWVSPQMLDEAWKRVKAREKTADRKR